ncbi:MAG: tetratricopeptide repeat protein [Candidatus Sericytochromatia bacterium]|nr:tetratricopeptide repeat protein [Candidatus Sericytochromatia bacterium]
MSAWRTHFQAGLAAVRAQDWSLAQASFEASMEALNAPADNADACPSDRAGIYHELAYVAFKTGRAEQAEAAYRQALDLVPDSIEDLNNLALLLQKRDPDQAMHLLEKALALVNAQPELAQDSELQLGLNLVETCKQSHPQKAYEWLQKAVLRFPQATQLKLQLAEMAENWLQYPRVIELVYASLAQLGDWAKPARAACWRQLARAYQATGEIEKAHWALQNAQECWPNPAFLIEKALLLPLIYRSQADLNHWRNLTETAIDDLFNGPPLNIPQPFESLQTAPFYLAFQGFNDRPLLEKLAQIYQRFLPQLPPLTTASKTSQQAKTESPIRVGFVSHCFFEHSVLHLFDGLIRGLDPTRFEVTVFAVAPVFRDNRSHQLADSVAHYISLEGPLEGMLAQIQAQAPEVLVYTDLGSDPFTWLLAQYRLAPLQWVLPGIMHTTGFQSLDAYLAPDCMEPPGAENHYSEPLQRLHTLPVMPVKPRRTDPLLSRAELGLPADRHVYLCPMTPFKFHPGFDTVLSTIFAEDPLADIWILQHRQDGICRVLHQRLQKALAPNEEETSNRPARITFAPWFSKERFLHLLEQVDVVLDSWPVGGGNTVFTCLGLGIPLVSWASPFFRGRVAQGAYQYMGITDAPVADNAQDCARLALKLAHDKSWRSELQTEILAKNNILFENPASLAEFSDLLSEHVLSLRAKSV